MEVPVNYLAVLLAAVASMGVGFLWYSPVLFAKQWMKESGLTAKDIEAGKDKAKKMYMMSAVGALVMAYVLHHVMVFAMKYMGTAPLMTGLTTAFWMWLGFIAPVQMTEVLFGGKSAKLYAINTGYQLASILVMGLVLGVMNG